VTARGLPVFLSTPISKLTVTPGAISSPSCNAETWKKTSLSPTLVGSVVLIAAGLAFRDARRDAPPPSTKSDVDERVTSVNKSDRLPLPRQISAANAQPDLVQPVAAPPEQLPLATEDDIRQAEAERHRHRDICPHGRTYFTIEHHQYWRCVR
jgi:hypothetical protein